MVEIPLVHIGIVVGVFLLMFYGLFAAHDDLRKRVEDMESKASQKLREAIVNVSALPLTDNQLCNRVTRLEKVECHRRGIIELTQDAGKIDYAQWIIVAKNHGWIKE